MRFKKASKRIGDILIEEGFLDPQDLKKALEIQKHEGGLIGQILVRMGVVKEENLVLGLSKQLSIPYIRLNSYSVNRGALAAIPKETAEKYLVFPFDHDDRSLSVAIADPLNEEAVEFLKKTVRGRLDLFIGTVSDIKTAIDIHYKNSSMASNRSS